MMDKMLKRLKMKFLIKINFHWSLRTLIVINPADPRWLVKVPKIINN